MTNPTTQQSMQEKCDRAPEGWQCTRTKGHEGPCAAQKEKSLLLISLDNITGNTEWKICTPRFRKSGQVTYTSLTYKAGNVVPVDITDIMKAERTQAQREVVEEINNWIAMCERSGKDIPHQGALFHILVSKFQEKQRLGGGGVMGITSLYERVKICDTIRVLLRANYNDHYPY